ncbi:MAG: glycosyltransferase family 2 protein [Azonexus sp.]|nr:glycosyltransferase family 2 protein [Azonexus sp.]
MTAIPALPSLPEHRLSIVIPLYNEELCVAPMVERVHECLADYPWPWELIFVDDGSRDDTLKAIHKAIVERGSHIRCVELARNFKQTAAMQAGIDAAEGDVIVTLDGDLQNDPVDIPRMVARLLNEDLDLVAGWRKNRQDGLWLRKIPSRIANRLIGRVTGLRLHDYGCSLKAFRGEVIKSVRLYGEMHRFIPAWLATVTSPRRIDEEPVSHHPRTLGESKYGISRTFRVILDLLSVYFFLRFRDRPGHFFGGAGLALIAAGSGILGYMAILKLLGESIGSRPLLMLGFFVLLGGLQCILTGVLAENLSRVYLGGGGNGGSYVRRYRKGNSLESSWHQGQQHPESIKQ